MLIEILQINENSKRSQYLKRGKYSLSMISWTTNKECIPFYYIKQGNEDIKVDKSCMLYTNKNKFIVTGLNDNYIAIKTEKNTKIEIIIEKID